MRNATPSVPKRLSTFDFLKYLRICSCADILAIAARDSVVLLGGHTWDVKLGRRDSLNASLAAANNGSIPAPTSSLTNLTNRFNQLGLNKRDLVALSGAHTIGQARCTTFRNRIYNETNINEKFAEKRRTNCPSRSGSGDNNLAPLDRNMPSARKFDNNYFKNLLDKKGLLHSDQVLTDDDSTDSIVEKYSKDPKSFDKDFAEAMIKMGDISPLLGNQGQIRLNCRKINN